MLKTGYRIHSLKNLHSIGFWRKIHTERFCLDPEFVKRFSEKESPFGFNGLGELVYRRTYSRIKEDGFQEEWHETVARVVNGTYNMQKRWIDQNKLGWNEAKAQRSAKEMYSKIFDMKFVPPGRGLWAMGSPLTEERGLYAALNNCAFVSTVDIAQLPSPARPFEFCMDAAMLGVGVGFDTKGAGQMVVRGPNKSRPVQMHVIEDSREGWVRSASMLIDSYLLQQDCAPLEFDYSLVRPAGSPIHGFGGVASGPRPLQELHASIRTTFDKCIGERLSITNIVDIMNLIGKCVVSGNVRRTAEIAFGDPFSEEYVSLKDYTKNPQRMEYGWTSNNSVYAPLGMDYTEVCKRVVANGEPGFAWLENMQKYSRMCDAPDMKDARAMGGNPCLEQTLESYEACTLVETFPFRHTSIDDFKDTLKYAFLYAKTVTLGSTHWPETNRVMLRNRRVGCSMSGIAQFITQRGIGELRKWCDQGFQAIQDHDRNFSEWLAVPRSVKTTSIKPSGTVSLLAGATPGMHYPEAEYYLRRVRLPNNSPLIPPLVEAGYKTEPSVTDPDHTTVVEFPVHAGNKVRTVKDLSMWEQLSLAAFLQKHWADNQVSCTVTFDPATEASQLPHALDYFQYQLKGVSFLPRLELGAYPQMPYEAIDEATYSDRVRQLKHLHLSVKNAEEPTPEKFCDAGTCSIDGRRTVIEEEVVVPADTPKI